MRKSLPNRISAADLKDYLSRRLSSKQIAEIYGSKSTYVIKVLPKRPPKEPPIKVKEVMAARWEYRDKLAKLVIEGHMTIAEAAKQAYCTQRTMYRHQKRMKECLKTCPSTEKSILTSKFPTSASKT